jgi:putative drug exporter of the RND superfamily
MPIVVVAFLFGVSMDYQVFIVSRMREAYDRSGSTRTAVVEGIGRTGRLVTAAALILALAFLALSGTPGTENKMFATALAAGILLDATLIRGLLLPASVAILGRWNWWLPRRPARLLRVEPSFPSHPRRRRSSDEVRPLRRPTCGLHVPVRHRTRHCELDPDPRRRRR